MTGQAHFAKSILVILIVCFAATLQGQQKPQWMPGQVGLNAGIVPSPGFTYSNITVGYRSGAFSGPRGSAIPATGNYNVCAVENIFYYVPDLNVLHGNIGMYFIPTPATGSLAAASPLFLSASILAASLTAYEQKKVETQ